MTRREEIISAVQTHWPAALAAWSAHTLLREPTVLVNATDERRAGVVGQIASIRLTDSTIFLNVPQIERLGLNGCELALLAHEVGHHIYVPGNLAEHTRLFVVLQRRLDGLPSRHVPMVANLWADILINDRLQRETDIDIAEVYRRLRRATKKRAAQEENHGATPPNLVWQLYMRTYEVLWRQDAGTLIDAKVITTELDGDALLCAQIARSFANDPVRGGSRYASVLYRWLALDDDAMAQQTFDETGLSDTKQAGMDRAGQPSQTLPDAVMRRDPLEDEDDGDLLSAPNTNVANHREDHAQPLRSPRQVAALLRAMGLAIEQGAMTAMYYRRLATPHLIRFPMKRARRAMEQQIEGLDPWNPGDPLDQLEILESLALSPRLVPGVTTVRRHFGEVPGREVGKRALDLDIYIDCSGSMPNPQHHLSYLTLAGAIVALSALRAGGRVQVTLWSSRGQVERTAGFERNESAVLAMLCGFVSGGTRFPLEHLAETYKERNRSDNPVHILVISDDGVDTMLNSDQHGRAGALICREALAGARGGGTLVLNLRRDIAQWPPGAKLAELGFSLHRVQQWPELLAFARAFAASRFGEEEP